MDVRPIADTGAHRIPPPLFAAFPSLFWSDPMLVAGQAKPGLVPMPLRRRSGAMAPTTQFSRMLHAGHYGTCEWLILYAYANDT